MHPAYSVIVFSCASGAGFGLLVLIGLGIGLGRIAASRELGLLGIGTGLALITVGLLSSVFHLGRPERAWRALSHWRTSWLSRQGILALASHVPALVMAAGLVQGGDLLDWLEPAAWLAAAFGFATLWSTGMIYESRSTIRAWCHPLVAPLYVLLGLATGALLFNLLLLLVDPGGGWASVFALIALVAAWIAKTSYWADIDAAARTHTIGEATGLGRLGAVRVLDPPHAQANVALREMGYEVARRHRERLRGIAVLLLFLLPAIAMLLVAVRAVPGLAVPVSAAAVLSAAAGVIIERWLFFAEAEHVSMLFYGRQTA